MAQKMDPSYYANLPAGPPPAGVVPNLDHPQSRASQAYIAMGLFIAVDLVFVILRVYVKVAVTHNLGWDDCESCEQKNVPMLTPVGACLMGFVKAPVHLPVSVTLTYQKGTYRRLRCPILRPQVWRRFSVELKAQANLGDSVMGPGGGLGTHLWDIRAGRITKAFLQARDPEISARSKSTNH